jgi:hypothetical protein
VEVFVGVIWLFELAIAFPFGADGSCLYRHMSGSAGKVMRFIGSQSRCSDSW